MPDQGRLSTWLQRLSRNAVSLRVSSTSADRPLTLSHIGSAEELAAEIAAAKQRLSAGPAYGAPAASAPMPLRKATSVVPPVPAPVPKSTAPKVAVTPTVTPVPPAPKPAPPLVATPKTVPSPSAVTPTVVPVESTPKPPSPVVAAPQPASHPTAATPASSAVPQAPAIPAPAAPAPASEPKRLSFVEAEERAIEARIAELRVIEERAAQRRIEIEHRLAALTPDERVADAADAADALGSPITIKIGRLDAVQETNALK